MKSFLKWLILAPVALVLLVFAIANREPVRVVLDPLSSGPPDFQIVAPLFIVLFLTAMLGVLAGGVATWLAQGRHRRAARHAKSDVERLRGECDRLRAQLTPTIPAIERPRDAA
ncbi:MAG: LapA family protein [Beijerinckiaceae bacterium]|jgi:uncharacterized integral membrane protein|nr:LapA family protein [Beijerinckiaceae bacterium]MDO9441337.1 LapA family protein [Beijerinckiaceae bacterium]